MWNYENTQVVMTEPSFDRARDSFLGGKHVSYKRHSNLQNGSNGPRMLEGQYFLSGEQGNYVLTCAQKKRAEDVDHEVTFEIGLHIPDGLRGGTESILDQLRAAFPVAAEVAR